MGNQPQYSTWADLKKALDIKWQKAPLNIVEVLSNIIDFRERMHAIVLNLPYAENKYDLPSKSGIYFLINHNEIQYIGKSFNIRGRWMRRVDFEIGENDRVYYLLDDLYFDLDTMETFFISIFLPRYNRRINARVKETGWWNQIRKIS
jgi:hypothetical protein